ncbi:MAG: hypothetical protein KC656_34055, partial [Myxococcales bacterium]|nr:hypothetical protein [Myxococcales bacterium]
MTGSPLVCLRPFDGMCLTAGDLAVEQEYHRRSLARHARWSVGEGVVAGLAVDVEVPGGAAPRVRVGAGFGLRADGVGVEVCDGLWLELDPLPPDGEHGVWVVVSDAPDPASERPVLDGPLAAPARAVECVGLVLAPSEAVREGVLVAFVRVRLGRVVLLPRPVPRAVGRRTVAVSPREAVIGALATALTALLEDRARDLPSGSASVALLRALAALAAVEVRLLEPGASDAVLLALGAHAVASAHAALGSDSGRPL